MKDYTKLNAARMLMVGCGPHSRRKNAIYMQKDVVIFANM